MSMATSLDPNENGEDVEQREYMTMIGSLCTSRRHSWTFSSSCAFVHAFRLSHAPHIGQQFSESSATSNTLLSLGFGILLLLRLILLAFLMLILRGVALTERALLLLANFSDLLLFAGLLKNNLLWLNPPQRLSM
jgi:uncharacterized membrane protein